MEALNKDLWSCCVDCGVDQPELPSEIVAVVQRWFELDRGRRITVRDIEHLVIRLLLDSGFWGLAVRFGKMRGHDPAHARGDWMEADLDSVVAVLRESPRVDSATAGPLADRVVRALRDLGLDECSSPLAVELAVVLNSRMMDGDDDDESPDSATRPETDGFWLLRVNEVADLISTGEGRALVNDGSVRVRPVSTLVPCVRVRLNMAAHNLRRSPCIELQAFPEFDRLCSRTASILVELEEVVLRRLRQRSREGEFWGAVVHLDGMDELAVSMSVRERSKSCRMLRAELRSIAEVRFQKVPDLHMEFH